MKGEPGLSNKRLRIDGSGGPLADEREGWETRDDRGGEGGGSEEVAPAAATNGPPGRRLLLGIACAWLDTWSLRLARGRTSLSFLVLALFCGPGSRALHT